MFFYYCCCCGGGGDCDDMKLFRGEVCVCVLEEYIVYVDFSPCFFLGFQEKYSFYLLLLYYMLLLVSDSVFAFLFFWSKSFGEVDLLHHFWQRYFTLDFGFGKSSTHNGGVRYIHTHYCQ